MFGLVRTYLALFVMAFHLLSIPIIGEYAVFSFFVLSGYLMTTIVHNSYGYSLGGFCRYALNRFLRLYPSYWIAALFSVLIILFCGRAYMQSYRSVLDLPANLVQVAQNATMVFFGPFPSHVVPRLSPPTWAITVELFYYALIGVGVSKTLFRTRIWMALSVLYVLATLVLRLPYEYRYGHVLAGSLPFSIGAFLFFAKDRLYRLVRSPLTSPINLMLAQVALFGVFAVIEHRTHFAPAKNLGIYLDILVMAALVLRLDRDGAPGIGRRLDKRIGDFSYPIYLLHWPFGALASFLLFRRPALGFNREAALAWGLALVFVLAASALLVFGVDPAIERLRGAVRSARGRPGIGAGEVSPGPIGAKEAQG